MSFRSQWHHDFAMLYVELYRCFKYLIVIIILIFYIPSSYGQSKDSLIRAIQKSYKQINNDRKLVFVKLENENFMEQMTDGGGSLMGYFKNDTIYKIHVWIGLSFGVRQYDYYFNNGKLCFVYEIEANFLYDEKKASLHYNSLKLGFEGRYYINSGQLIHKMLKGKRRQSDNKTIDAKVQEFDINAQSYGTLLLKQLKKVIANHKKARIKYTAVN